MPDSFLPIKEDDPITIKLDALGLQISNTRGPDIKKRVMEDVDKKRSFMSLIDTSMRWKKNMFICAKAQGQ